MTRDFDPWIQAVPDIEEADVSMGSDVTVDAILDDEEAATFARHVAVEAHQLRVKTAARELVAEERAGQAPPFDYGTLTEILARPPEPPYRVEELIPCQGATLVVAQRKTGKTTFDLNLARSLITGTPFLGRFEVRPIAGKVGILNYEVSAAQLARWAHDVGVPAERLVLVNLRGRRNPLAVAEDMAELAGMLRKDEVESLIVDPFGRAYTGASQNDNGEVGAWLTNLDRFTRSDVGAVDVVLSVHAGWEGERSRGASALEDWADTIVTLTRNSQDEADEARYMKATGRDVDIEEDKLDYDPPSRLLSVTGAGSRRVAGRVRHIADLLFSVVDIVADSPGINGKNVEDQLRENGVAFHNGDGYKALALGVERGHIEFETVGRTKKYSVVEIGQNGVPPRTPAVPPGGPLAYPRRNDPLGEFRGYAIKGSENDEETAVPPRGSTCAICSQPLHDLLVVAGETVHPLCQPEDAP